VTKRALGDDVFKKGASIRRGKLLDRALIPEGQAKVSLLLTHKEVEMVEDLQLLLSQRGYGKYTRSEIVRVAIRKVNINDFARRAE